MSSCCSKTAGIVRNIDQFGHPIEIYLDKEGGQKDSFKSIGGGVLTILVYSFLIACSVGKFERMVYNQNPQISTAIKVLEKEPLEKYSIDKLHFLPKLIFQNRSDPNNAPPSQSLIEEQLDLKLTLKERGLSASFSNCTVYEKEMLMCDPVIEDFS